MASEYELKACLRGRLREFRQRVEGAGWELQYRGRMTDRRYDTPDEELGERDEVLRLRLYDAEFGRSRAVLAWKGAASEADGFKLREEVETEIRNPDRAGELLERLGYSRVTMEIDRRIESWERTGVTLRIEEYPRMDTLVEIEGDPGAVESRLADLGLRREEWKAWPLDRFVHRFEERTGSRARLAGGPEHA